MTEATAAPVTLGDYMREFAPAMAARVAGSLRPLFDPATTRIGADLQALCEGDGITPYTAQALTVEGSLHLMKRRKWVNIVGEMGVGKTLLAGWALRFHAERHLHRPVRAVISCPNQLVKKWRDHMLALLPGASVTIVNDWRSLWHLRRRKTPKEHEVYIIPRDKGKLSYAWRPAVTVRRRLGKQLFEDGTGHMAEYLTVGQYLSCPGCGGGIKVEDKGRVYDAMTEDLKTKSGKIARRQVCQCDRVSPNGDTRVCGEPMWQAHNGKAFDIRVPVPGIAPRRVSPAEFIFRQRLRFDVYVCDEMHELKGGDTLQGQMLAWLARRSDKVITMTGTLAGGYARDLFHILWRTCPQDMVADGIEYSDTGIDDFTRRYGVMQVDRKYLADKPGISLDELLQGKAGKKSRAEKTLPGISPLVFSKFLMPSTVFLRLMEMHEELPPFRERVHTIPLGYMMAAALRKMTDDFNEHCHAARGARRPVRSWSAARAAFLRWPDRPWPEQTIYDRDADGNPFPVFTVPALPQDLMFAKELRLLRLARLNKAKGRKCWIFTELTGPRWNVTDRYAQMFARHGISVAVLHSEGEGGPKPEDREEWIARNTADVVISNPNLVKTGLDLYDFPTIIFAYTGDSTYTLRQASRRSWRLGQKHDCEVHYLCYRHEDKMPSESDKALAALRASAGHGSNQKDAVRFTCLQAAAMTLMSKKMASSLALEGDFSAHGLAAMAPDLDIQSQLARVIAGSLTLDDPRKAFAEYRKSLEKMMPNIGRKNKRTEKVTIHGTPTAQPAAPAPTPKAPVARKRKPMSFDERVKRLERTMADTLGESLYG